MFQLLINSNLPFMRHRRFAYLASGVLVLGTVAWLLIHAGPRYSVDFTGGTLLQIRLSQVLPADQVRSALEGAGFHGVERQQMTGVNHDEFMLRVGLGGQGEHRNLFGEIASAIESRHAGVKVELRRTEQVGPKVGKELREKAVWAVLCSLGVI